MKRNVHVDAPRLCLREPLYAHLLATATIVKNGLAVSFRCRVGIRMIELLKLMVIQRNSAIPKTVSVLNTNSVKIAALLCTGCLTIRQ